MTQKTARPSSVNVDAARRKIRVLLIEDDEGDRFVVQEVLAQSARRSNLEQFELEQAENLSEGLGQLLLGGIDIVLLDLSLPDSRGIESLQRVRSAAPDIPVVILSGLSNEELALEAVRQGAQDYLMKGQVEFNWLARIMRYAIERKQAELENRRLYRELEQRINERTAQLEDSYRKLASEIELHRDTRTEADARAEALRAFADAVGVGAVYCDRTGRIQISTSRVREVTGIDWKDFSRRQWIMHGQFFEEDGQTAIRPDRLPLARALDGETIDWTTIVMRLPGREPARMRVKAFPLIDADGEKMGAIALVNGA